MNIDPNKIIATFSDCRGTCKTPIGCSCGKMQNDDEEEDIVRIKETLVIEKKVVSIATPTVIALPENNGSVLKQNGSSARICSCGQSSTGYCGCKAKKGASSCCSGTNKLEVYDWLQDMPEIMTESKMVEVQFKNTRKGYFVNSNDIELYKGDVVAVEASPGHDIGEVTLTGKLVDLQMKKMNFRGEVRRVYRIAKDNDLEKYEQARGREFKTMLRARELAEELQLDMKISDVEYQGDGNKAIFYYIADGRVDFRQLIKLYASEFRVKIEMKQIGARQEAGRVGGIGPCGRELCCSSSMSNFVSVSTSAARLQDIPLNPQKLAGQCGKLKCCLNFEVDTYVEAQKKLPPREIVLEAKDASFFHFKTDILSGMMTYSTDRHFAANLVTLPKDRVFEIIRQNKKGDRPLTLIDHSAEVVEDTKSHDVLEQESITRFDDESRGDNKRNKRKRNNNRPQNQNRDRDNQDSQNRNSKGSNNRPVKNNEGKKVVTKAQDVKNDTKVVATSTEPKVKDEQQQQQRPARKRNNNRRNNNNRPQNKDRENQTPQQNNRNPRNEKKDDK